jgi:hypothetical protein
MLYVVIETLRDWPQAVYERAGEQVRIPPEDLRYIPGGQASQSSASFLSSNPANWHAAPRQGEAHRQDVTSRSTSCARKCRIVGGIFVADVSADPDLWGFCGDAAAQETVVLDSVGTDDHGFLPKPRPPRTGRLKPPPSNPATPSGRGHHW